MTLLLVGVTYGIQPYRGRPTGWTNPAVLAAIALGASLLVLFVLVERRVDQPMFDLRLFRIRAFSAGNAALLLTSIARGGLQFVLVMWLQGIWLPLHGYPFGDTPLWAGIYLLPLTGGFMVAGPIAGMISDRVGARVLTTAGLLIAAAALACLLVLPVEFPYPMFAASIALAGVGHGMFSAPNTAAIMSSVPSGHRGSGSGMRATFQNSGMALSVGFFFSLMIAGIATHLPAGLAAGLRAQHVPAAVATRVAALPPVSTLFAAFLGYNPLGHLLTSYGVLNRLPAANAATITSTRFFPQLVAEPFHHGLVVVFAAATVMAVAAAAASLARGGHSGDNNKNPDNPN